MRERTHVEDNFTKKFYNILKRFKNVFAGPIIMRSLFLSGLPFLLFNKIINYLGSLLTSKSQK